MIFLTKWHLPRL